MFQRFLTMGRWNTALSALWLLLVPGLAAAQQGWHLYEETGRGWGRSTATPVYTTPANTYTSPSSGETGYRSFYPSSTALGNAVEINVSVPASAQIWFGNAKTTQGGAFRHFVSPPIVPGFDYVYEVRVAWTADGKSMTRNRKVTVHAGDVINLNFDTNR